MSKPRLLDLYCGAGGAAMGYAQAGFEVVGVDIEPHPEFPFEFHRANALEFPIEGFDAIHASPPCQAYTTMSNGFRGKGGGNSRVIGGRAVSHADLINETRTMLAMTHLPYVIENVHGARRKLVDPFTLSGGMFGLRVHRPRFFEVNFNLPLPPVARPVRDAIGIYGKLDGRRVWTRSNGTEQRAARTLEEAQEAMGIDWMGWDDLKESIPPAYTEWIGKHLIRLVLPSGSSRFGRVTTVFTLAKTRTGRSEYDAMNVNKRGRVYRIRIGLRFTGRFTK